MSNRPLLLLPSITKPIQRHKKNGQGSKYHLPSRTRQKERLTPKFSTLENILENKTLKLSTDTQGNVPEEVIVLETVGPIENFIAAVRNVQGLEWLGEIELEDIPPDDDFFMQKSNSVEKSDKSIRGRLFLIFTNHQAFQELLSLWNRWLSNEKIPYGFGKWSTLFSMLRDIRPWGLNDRLLDTGILADWEERIEYNEEELPCEIELWHRTDNRRIAARNKVYQLVQNINGQILQETIIEEIGYHSLIARLPISEIQPIIGGKYQESTLIQCEQIQFFRAVGQMASKIHEDSKLIDNFTPDTSLDLDEPVVALFDGLPLQNHRRLENRLIIDDPDDFEANYQAHSRIHGTAMASLIVNGDLGNNESPLKRFVYVRPIMQPNLSDYRSNSESVPENTSVVDLIHRAVRRIFEGENNTTPIAPQICVINLSICIQDRMFDNAMSPLARLLDWLSWKYKVLFLVSSGNHTAPIRLEVSALEIEKLTTEELRNHVVKAVASDTRNRRLLSPAEAINILTIGAINDDFSSEIAKNTIQPFATDKLPSIINAHGMGYRRSIKPDILISGGKVVLEKPLNDSSHEFNVYTRLHQPGQLVCAPGKEGELNFKWHTRGTSNATALASRLASIEYDVIQELRQSISGKHIESIPDSIIIKALLVHGARWGQAGEVLNEILRNAQNTRQFKEYLTRLIGYGILDPSRIFECASNRVTAIGSGYLQEDQAHIHTFPLPPSLSGRKCFRRLIITLAWFTPINPMHQAWRRAHLWFNSPQDDYLGVSRHEADHNAVQRGTVQHEILEGNKATAYVDGNQLTLQVNCRSDAGRLEEMIPYAVAISLEVEENIGVDIYAEISTRIQSAHIRVNS